MAHNRHNTNAASIEEICARNYTEHSSIIMLIQRILDIWSNRARSGQPARKLALSPACMVLAAVFLTGCYGGSSTKTNNVVAHVTVSPTSLSLVAGQVSSISATAVNSSNATVAATITFNSSNTRLATISPTGMVCGGVWDSLFVVCNGNDALGNPVSGSATITATAGGVTSGPASLSVHPSVTSVSVDPPPAGCSSIAQTHQFVAHAFHNGTEITSQVGTITWSVSDGTVAGVDANGLATARVSGLAGVIASVGQTTSPAVFFKTCMPVQITLHLSGDTAGPTESATLNVTDTKLLLADMVDENGVFVSPAPITTFSNNATSVTISGGTITAQSPGGAGIQAACTPPTCGNGLNTPVYSNVFSVSVNGISPITTTVYAASTFPPPINTAIPLIPIDISQTPPVVGAAIPLPGTPNSMVFDRTGARAFLGTAVGLVALDTTANTISVVAPNALGKVLAVSPDGNKVIVSNAANDPSTGTPIEPNLSNQRVFVFDRAANTLTTFVAAGAVAAAYDDDSFHAYIVANGNVYVFSPLQTFLTTSVSGASIDATPLASGPFVYIANSGALKAIATCNNTLQGTQPTINSSTVQLVGSVKNANQIVAVEATGVDVETVAVTPLAPPLVLTSANCAPNVSYSNQFVDFGQGAFTANQLLVSPDGVHMAVLPAGINKIFTVLNGNNAGVAQLPAGATQAVGGSMTPDGNTIWVGGAGTNSVDRVNLRNNVDDVHLPMTFKKSDGSPAPPNLVVIKPK